MCRENYTYEYDSVQYNEGDRWNSHAEEVLAGKKWKDDCDGLGSTVIDLLCQDNYPDNLLYRAMVSSKGDDKIDHFIGIASDGNALYVIGDTFGPVYSIKGIRHKIIAVSRIADGIKWHKVNHKDFVK